MVGQVPLLRQKKKGVLKHGISGFNALSESHVLKKYRGEAEKRH